jgi:hypothetical protein
VNPLLSAGIFSHLLRHYKKPKKRLTDSLVGDKGNGVSSYKKPAAEAGDKK